MGHPIDRHDTRTTAGETFKWDDHCRLAYLIHVRFGRDLEAGAAAWRRLLQNSCPVDQFEQLVNEGALLALEDKKAREVWEG